MNHNQAWTMFLEALAARDKDRMHRAMEIMAATTFRRIL